MGRTFKGPAFTWQQLRRCCGTFITNSNIYPGAGPWLSAKRLGHSVQVAEARYVGALTTIDPAATKIEDAMGIADLLASVGAKKASTA